jgi:hypothetical protein
MPPTRALYSVVQYVPDDSRAEAANVGVVLYVPSRRWLEVRVSPSLERVRQFFHPGRQELRRIELALEAFKHRMEIARGEFSEESDLTQFASARADAVRLSVPRLVMVEEPPSELDALYTELVGDRERALAAAMHAQMLPPPRGRSLWPPRGATKGLASREDHTAHGRTAVRCADRVSERACELRPSRVARDGRKAGRSDGAAWLQRPADLSPPDRRQTGSVGRAFC